MAFVRSSKYRHVFGQEAKKENCYDGFRSSNCAFEGTFIACNEKLIAFCVEVGGSGAFTVLPVNKTGRLPAELPKVSAHKEYILDIKWSPFIDEDEPKNSMLATCSEDGSIKIWVFKEEGLIVNQNADKALVTFEYHEKRCVQLAWHPVAKNVLMSVSQEPKICIWNLDEGVCEIEFDASHLGNNIVYNADWSPKGDKIVCCSKDKKFRVFNARFPENGNPLICEGLGHEGAKPTRVIFSAEDDRLISCGFSKKSERQIKYWNIVDNKKIEEMSENELDTANGVLIPYLDRYTNMLYVAAKGDTVIRYYEITDKDPYIHYISTYQGKEGQRNLCCIPKNAVDVNINEVMKFYKIQDVKSVGSIRPISFTVPRKSDLFQDDLYAPTNSSISSMADPSEWFAGANKEPNLVDMSTFFKGKTKPKAGASGGGLKKAGGLKGLKAKKDAKDAKKTESAPSEPTAAPVVQKTEQRKTPSPEPAPVTKSSSSSSSSSAGVNSKEVSKLQEEVESLKDNEKKMKKEIKSLTDKLKDYDKLTGDIKLLCDAVKKNDERLNALEALVQEDSETEES